MKRYWVIQSYSGAISRFIEAETEEEAIEKMLNEDFALDEMMDCNWDYPEVMKEE